MTRRNYVLLASQHALRVRCGVTLTGNLQFLLQYVLSPLFRHKYSTVGQLLLFLRRIPATANDSPLPSEFLAWFLMHGRLRGCWRSGAHDTNFTLYLEPENYIIDSVFLHVK